jgi:hypothetical protein
VDSKGRSIMKPHFGQSDAAMNKLAGCNSFPNANKGLEMIAELEQKANDAGYETPLEYLKAQHEEAAGMPLENAFFNGLTHKRSGKKIDPPFNTEKSAFRKLLEDNGHPFEDEEYMTPEPLPDDYYEPVLKVCTKSKVALRTLRDETKGYVITVCFVPREWAGKTVDVVVSLEEKS